MRNMFLNFGRLALSAMVIEVSAADAHIVLEEPSAAVGSSYKAVFKVGHGCDGSGTTGIRVELPDGVVGAKPMPKAGWTLETRTEPLKEPLMLHGRKVDTRVSQVAWSGGLLPDAYYDEFVVRVTLPATAGKRWFKVYQTCEKGQNDWVEIPQPGQTGLRREAAALEILPARPQHGQRR